MGCVTQKVFLSMLSFPRNELDLITCKCHNNPKYWDRQAFSNGIDPDQRLQNTAKFIQQYFNTSTGGRMNYFNFQEKYGK